MDSRFSFPECIGLGLAMATGFTVIAAGIALIFAIVALVSGQGLSAGASWLSLIGAAATVVGGYYLGGLVGGAAYYPLQWIQSRLVGQIVLAFVFGFVGYGAIGLTAAIAFSCCGVNVIDYESPAEAWRQLPSSTLALAALSAILGPIVWRIQRLR